MREQNLDTICLLPFAELFIEVLSRKLQQISYDEMAGWAWRPGRT